MIGMFFFLDLIPIAIGIGFIWFVYLGSFLFRKVRYQGPLSAFYTPWVVSTILKTNPVLFSGLVCRKKVWE
jgi:hypothetical protein